MHIFLELVLVFVKLLMRVAMFFTRGKTNYLQAPADIIPYQRSLFICKLAHLFPSLIVSVIIGVKILPGLWPYYAEELDKNGYIIPIAIFLVFIPITIINGIILERIITLTNARYAAFKNDLEV